MLSDDNPVGFWRVVFVGVDGHQEDMGALQKLRIIKNVGQQAYSSILPWSGEAVAPFLPLASQGS